MTEYKEGNSFTHNQTLVSDNRLANIIMYAYKAKVVPGDYAEFGVFRGGVAELLAKGNPEKQIYAIDSFEGLPAPHENDTHKEGDFKETDIAGIRRYFAWFHPNVEFIKGFSPDVFNAISGKRFAFVHIDVDLYESVWHACDFFYPRMNKGGIMIFDDYKWMTTPGAEKAISEFFADKNPTVQQELKYIDGASHYQYIVIV